MDFLDFQFIMTEVLPELSEGFVQSLWLIIPAVFIGGFFGIVMGVVRVFGAKPLQKIANAFVAVVRGVPLTIQLMILYFGLPYIKIYFEPYTAALLGFIFCTGAYQSEYVRGALLSIKSGQIKAGQALGMTKWQIIRTIIVPQAFRRAIPGCGNEIIYLIKYSSLAYLVTHIELTGEAKIIASRTFRPTEVYVIAACYYLLLVTLATYFLNKLEQKLHIPGFTKAKS